MKSIIGRETIFKNNSAEVKVTPKKSPLAFVKDTQYAHQSTELDKPSTQGSLPSSHRDTQNCITYRWPW